PSIAPSLLPCVPSWKLPSDRISPRALIFWLTGSKMIIPPVTGEPSLCTTLPRTGNKFLLSQPRLLSTRVNKRARKHFDRQCQRDNWDPRNIFNSAAKCSKPVAIRSPAPRCRRRGEPGGRELRRWSPLARLAQSRRGKRTGRFRDGCRRIADYKVR